MAQTSSVGEVTAFEAAIIEQHRVLKRALRGPTPVSEGPSISGFTPTTGKAGDTITISGERLQDTALVRIGAGRIEAQDLGRDRTSIKGNVPGNATTGEVIVFTPLGVAISAEEFKMT